jgi:hypothetical protein
MLLRFRLSAALHNVLSMWRNRAHALETVLLCVIALLVFNQSQQTSAPTSSPTGAPVSFDAFAFTLSL